MYFFRRRTSGSVEPYRLRMMGLKGIYVISTLLRQMAIWAPYFLEPSTIMNVKYCEINIHEINRTSRACDKMTPLMPNAVDERIDVQFRA